MNAKEAAAAWIDGKEIELKNNHYSPSEWMELKEGYSIGVFCNPDVQWREKEKQ